MNNRSLLLTGYSSCAAEGLQSYRSAKGPYLFTSDGKKILDGLAGSMNANLGHGNDRIADVMRTQAKSVCAVSAVGGEASEAAIELANRLSNCLGAPELVSTFCSSGSEATEAALAIVWKYWRELGRPEKRRILSLKESYHGCTLGALTVTGRADEHTDIGGVLPAFGQQLPSWDPSNDQCVTTALRNLLAAQSPDTFGAIILEPIMGLAGMVPAPRKDIQGVVRICTSNDIIIIVDEALTGLGRTGYTLASDLYEIDYDILLLSKGLGCGFTPIASTSITKRLADILRKSLPSLRHGHTASGNALSARVACTVLDEIEHLQVISNAQKLGEYMLAQIGDAAQRFGIVQSVYGHGFCVAVRLTDSRAANEVAAAAFKLGLRIRAIDRSVILAPPLNISKKICSQIVERLVSAISEIAEKPMVI